MRYRLYMLPLGGIGLLFGCGLHAAPQGPQGATAMPALAGALKAAPAPEFVQPFTETPVTLFLVAGGSNVE